MKYKNDLERQKKFHHFDSSITIDELWKLWVGSEGICTSNYFPLVICAFFIIQVYNWKINDVLNWLYNDVSLEKYIKNFERNKLDGRFIPRLAANENGYLTKVLKIKDFRDRNKIILKATDLVLFGPQCKIYSHTFRFR